MQKETYYFSHDYNAHDDPKMVSLLTTHGLSAVGLYWILMEILHQQEDGCVEEEQLLNYANWYSATDEKIDAKQIIETMKKLNLLVWQNDLLSSRRVLEHKTIRNTLSKKRSVAGKKGAKIKWKNTEKKEIAIAKQLPSNCLAKHSKGKERKGKENISKEIKQDFGNPLVSFYIEELKRFQGLSTLDDTIGKNRQYAYLLLKNKITPFLEEELKRPPGEEEQKTAFLNVLNRADQFHRKNMTSIKYIYYNFNKIIS